MRKLLIILMLVPFALGQQTNTKINGSRTLVGDTTTPATINVAIPNAGATGTTVQRLAKLTGAGTAVIATTSDTTDLIGIVVAGAGTTGNAEVAKVGIALCDFDGGVTQNDYVQASTTTGGKCHDAGASYPTTLQIIGRVVSATNGATAAYAVMLDPGIKGYVTAGSPAFSAITTATNTTATMTVGSGATINMAAGGIVDLSSGTVTNAFKLPTTTGAAPTTAGVVAYDSTANKMVMGDGSTTQQQATNTNTITFTNKTEDAEGTGNVITRPFYWSFSPGCNNATAGPGAFNVPTSGAATFTCFGTTTTQGAADFADAATSTITAGPISLPSSWSGAIDVTIKWFANAASANSVVWGVATGCVADTEAVSTGPSFNAQSTATTAYTGTANQQKTTSITGVATTNCASGESLYLQIQRLGANGSDTLTATAEAIEVNVKGRYSK